MQTIGQLLHTLRIKQNLSLEDVSTQTKIAPHLLAALEEDNFELLPTSTFTKGFITTYARVVGLSAQKALAIFRRDFAISESGKIMPRGLAKPLDKPTVVRSRVVWAAAVAFMIALFGGYIAFQLRGFHAPPVIQVVRPNTAAIVKGPLISVKGFVSADSSVYVNDNLAEIFPTGEFRASVQLPPGEQQIVVRAINSQNKHSQQVVPVTVVDN